MNPIKGLRRFLRNRRHFLREFDEFEKNGLLKDLRMFPGWLAILNTRKPPIDNGLPWISFPALQFLDKILAPGMQVFEWGCGGSTIFYARKGTFVTSIEHSLDWSKLVGERLLAGKYTGWSIQHIPPEPANAPDATICDHPSYLSTDAEFYGQKFLQYVCKIDSYQDKYFDIVAIDGRARSSCVMHAVPKVKQGGYLLWDNTERSEYQNAIRSVPDDWKRFDFIGPIVCGETFGCTTVWQASN